MRYAPPTVALGLHDKAFGRIARVWPHGFRKGILLCHNGLAQDNNCAGQGLGNGENFVDQKKTLGRWSWVEIVGRFFRLMSYSMHDDIQRNIICNPRCACCFPCVANHIQLDFASSRPDTSVGSSCNRHNPQGHQHIYHISSAFLQESLLQWKVYTRRLFGTLVIQNRATLHISPQPFLRRRS